MNTKNCIALQDKHPNSASPGLIPHVALQDKWLRLEIKTHCGDDVDALIEHGLFEEEKSND